MAPGSSCSRSTTQPWVCGSTKNRKPRSRRCWPRGLSCHHSLEQHLSPYRHLWSCQGCCRLHHQPIKCTLLCCHPTLLVSHQSDSLSQLHRLQKLTLTQLPMRPSLLSQSLQFSHRPKYQGPPYITDERKKRKLRLDCLQKETSGAQLAWSVRNVARSKLSRDTDSTMVVGTVLLLTEFLTRTGCSWCVRHVPSGRERAFRAHHTQLEYNLLARCSSFYLPKTLYFLYFTALSLYLGYVVLRQKPVAWITLLSLVEHDKDLLNMSPYGYLMEQGSPGTMRWITGETYSRYRQGQSLFLFISSPAHYQLSFWSPFPMDGDDGIGFYVPFNCCGCIGHGPLGTMRWSTGETCPDTGEVRTRALLVWSPKRYH